MTTKETEKLRRLWAMAAQDDSPNEAAIAREKLGGGPHGYFNGMVTIQGRMFRTFDDYLRWRTQEQGGSFCPGCSHSEFQHAGGTCYSCLGGTCGWYILGAGNTYGLKPGWHSFQDILNVQMRKTMEAMQTALAVIFSEAYGEAEEAEYDDDEYDFDYGYDR